jgi:hypothetical protein
MPTIVMPSFDISYPVVGTVKLTPKEPFESQSFLVADTYFDPLMEAVLKSLWRDGAPSRPAPRLLTMWQERTGAFDVEGGIHDFDPADGLIALLVESKPFLPVLPTDKVLAPDRDVPATLDEVRVALIAFLEANLKSSTVMIVEDLP